MSLSKKSWFSYIALSLIALALWIRFGYSEFSFINLSIPKNTALKIAREYLQDHQKINPENYSCAIVLSTEGSTDRYLQKTLGLEGELEFLKKYDLNLFSWLVRFFKEGEKEEYFITISASTGEVVSYSHIIEETAQRQDIGLEAAYDETKDFLVRNFAITFHDYTIKERVTKKYDNRTDYSFSWQKNNVNIPWSGKENAGTAKLLIKARVSGSEILFFEKNRLDIPDEFNRAIENSKQSGNILGSIFLVFYYLLIMASVYLIVTRRHHLVMEKAKTFYISLSWIIFILLIFYYINNIYDLFFDYPTTSTIKIYFTELSLHLLMASAFAALVIALPGLAGESLIQESVHKKRGFVHYLQTTFFSRDILGKITLGYLIAMILLGLQAFLFHIGRKYFNVWTEHMQISQMSSSFWPFVTAFVISFRASLSEEISFRLFGIQLGEKIFKNTLIACIFISVIWGFGHANYPIFPAWFRGVEVFFLGLLLSFFYLRYGIIPVVVGHYLADAFWGSAGFLIGKSQTFDFWTCLFIIALPLVFGLIAYIINKPDVEKKTFWNFKERHLYNLRILESFLSDPKNTAGKAILEIREDLLRHGWDTIVVDEALRRIEKNKVAN